MGGGWFDVVWGWRGQADHLVEDFWQRTQPFVSHDDGS